MLSAPVRVCFVCSGNICRSPTAEFVFTRLAADAGRSDLVAADSTGTGSWHAGADLDERSRAAMVDAGYEVPRHIAKQFTPDDFATRDVVVALDSGHADVLWSLAAETADPEAARAKIVLLRSFDPSRRDGEAPDVADPYYGGDRGFTEVLEQIERSCAELLAALARAVDSGAELRGDLSPAARQQDESPPR